MCGDVSRFRRSMLESPILIIEHQHSFRWIYCQFTIALVRKKPDRGRPRQPRIRDSVVASGEVVRAAAGALVGWDGCEVRLCDPVPACGVCPRESRVCPGSLFTGL